ncbi:related to thiamin pyrophosphokinase [Phialocephala subalpina]|uniref:Related to thiamin pyrophosphokinase n=1 Tax=Phialocephala subalpina TaxID=576137 RepID=A0A1L7XK40_9HELO|nr:related to thiamin pyrophosphokinase [Phialocephala subalpina]
MSLSSDINVGRLGGPRFPYVEFSENNKVETQLAKLWKFYLPNDTRPHGCLLDSVVKKMPWTNDFRLDHEPASNLALDEQLDLARSKNVFLKLGAKRDEEFPIIRANFELHIERSAGSLFGVICGGVRMTVYSRGPRGIRFWIAQRNLDEDACPGKLDNAVAGGIAVGEEPLDCLIKEAGQEAGFDEDSVLRDAEAAGTITWFYVAGELCLVNSGITYVYDMEVLNVLMLEPVDGDIKGIFSTDVDDILFFMKKGYFKPSSANAMMDFLMRHKYITAENEKDYAEILQRLHRTLPFPTSPSAA